MREDRVGVVGLGHMGGALAERLLTLVGEVHVYDVRDAAMAPLVELGAVPATCVPSLAAEVDVLVAALPNGRISAEVAAEAASSERLAVYVETSTIGPSTIQTIAETLGRRDVIDAPLSGGPRGIRAGSVASYISGPAAARARIAPWFDQICGTRTVLGDEVGAAQVAKLVNNAISLSGMAIASEAIAVGVAAGLDPKVLVSAVNAGTGRNSATEAKIPASVLTGRFDFGGPIALAEKDLELYLAMAADAGVTASTVETALESFREAILRFGSSADYTEIARIFESVVGAEIRHRPATDTDDAGGWRSETLD